MKKKVLFVVLTVALNVSVWFLLETLSKGERNKVAGTADKTEVQIQEVPSKKDKKRFALKSKLDTIAYQLGMVSSPANQLSGYLARLGSDSAYAEEYLDGVYEGLTIPERSKDIAYELGVQHGFSTKQQVLTSVSKQLFGEESKNKFNTATFFAGFTDMINNEVQLFINGEPMTQEQAQSELQGKIQEMISKREAVEYAPTKKAGEDFLAAKAQEEGVKVLSNGILYKVIRGGKVGGKKPSLNDKIRVAYKGMTIDGIEFDSNEGIEFTLSAMIEGWKIALPNMTEGSKWIIYIPQELAYGSRGAMPDIEPYSALVFEVELFAVTSPKVKK